MIRSLATSLFLATSAMAQTPVPISVANDLRACIRDTTGFRDAARLAQLDISMAQLPNGRWTSVTEVAPRLFHVTNANKQITIEIKLPDANGAAHCMAFGPMLTSGQAALTADKFVEFKFLAGLVPAAPVQGMSRRYTVSGAPYSAELVALQSTGHGEVVGFTFTGVPQNLTTRALSMNDPNVSYKTVSMALSNAINICLRNNFQRDTVEAAMPAGGYELGFADGRDQNLRTFFTSDDAVSLRIAPGQCTIETNYLSPSATIQIVQAALNTNAPGLFEYRHQNHNGCPAFYATRSLSLPLGINIYNNSGRRGPANCIEDGTTRITFEVAG